MSKLSEIHSNFKKEIQDCLKECEGACSQHASNSKCECEKSCLVILLEELQEYRKLGTVEELKKLITKEVAERRKLEEYFMLGSVEELRNLVNNDLAEETKQCLEKKLKS